MVAMTMGLAWTAATAGCGSLSSAAVMVRTDFSPQTRSTARARESMLMSWSRVRGSAAARAVVQRLLAVGAAPAGGLPRFLHLQGAGAARAGGDAAAMVAEQVHGRLDAVDQDQGLFLRQVVLADHAPRWRPGCRAPCPSACGPGRRPALAAAVGRPGQAPAARAIGGAGMGGGAEQQGNAPAARPDPGQVVDVERGAGAARVERRGGPVDDQQPRVGGAAASAPRSRRRRCRAFPGGTAARSSPWPRP